ncbi:MAG: GNAT family N-acetyltransferase [Bacteroidales bacterium]|nr:GNAT family N-acetyltransferase [Bacteroidales bacterium]MCF8458876.1 GNAT family N-acetyltransferase [Bacteroidales bacterium]
MLNYEIFTNLNPMGSLEKQRLIDFILRYYEDYGHTKKGIKKTIDYALKENYMIHPSFSHGGFVVVCRLEKEIVGTLVLNKTGYDDILPANMLMYIATHHDFRRQGIARNMIKQAKRFSNGNIATHVLDNNHSTDFFAHNGFNSRVIEMRLT